MTTATVNKNRLNFALKGAGNYDVIVVAFCTLLLISNIGATKLIQLGPFITDGGAYLFPLTYILGDLLAEVYGLKATKRAIKLGFIVSILASLTLYLVQIAPPAAGYDNQKAFEAVLGFVPRIVLASLCGYTIGQLLNSLVVVKMKERAKEHRLWARLVGSTVVGEFADTLVFCTVAFYGTITGWEFVNYVVTGYLYKCGVEIIMLPLTYRVIAWVKSREPSYYTAEVVGADPVAVPDSAH